MRVWCDAFGIPKGGNSEDEVEDAFFLPGRSEVSSEELTLALADGASEGAFSGWLAQCLVDVFGTIGNPILDAVVEEAVEKWGNRKVQYVKDREDQGKPLQWFEEASISVGGFSTLLGLRFRPSETHGEGTWNALAIGDTCLFQARADNLVCQFPPLASGEFNNHPHLISTSRQSNSRVCDFKLERSGNWRTGDSFYLMTDALAQWFVLQIEAGQDPWKTLRDVNSDGETFSELVERLREDGTMRNDDTTLIRIDILPEG